MSPFALLALALTYVGVIAGLTALIVGCLIKQARPALSYEPIEEAPNIEVMDRG